MKIKFLTSVLFGLAPTLGLAGQETIVETGTYSWRGDTIFQGDFFAFAPSETRIVSNYKAQPGYFMPIEGEWALENDISAYPKLLTDNKLHAAIYNMGLDEMVNAVEPDTTLRTGKEWSGVWTRDVSYSIILSMAQLQPEASKISLRKKISPDGRIIQDTGSGGAWPVSSDRMIWVVAAWEVYLATGDVDWLKEIFPVVEKSLAADSANVLSRENNLTKGETSFIDWREQSYPKWMQTADIYQSEALGTTVVQIQALKVASLIARKLGHDQLAEEYAQRAQTITEALEKELWLPEKGHHAMYNYGRLYPVINPRAETLGESLAILFDITTPEKAEIVTQSLLVTDYGRAVFSPQISDMPPYHNNALWPFVASYWALANAKAGNEQGLLEAIGSVYRPAALFATNKENLVLDNGDIATELNSSNMLWSLAGNLAITNRILFGINLMPDGILFHPVVPHKLAGKRQLLDYPYRGKKLNITVDGWGDEINSITLNGKQLDGVEVPEKLLKAENDIVIRMADKPFKQLAVNRSENVKAPLTPIAWLENDGKLLVWNPIEYIGKYIIVKDGQRIAETTQTTYPATERGEYMVIGVSEGGVESFASEPRNNFDVQRMQLQDETTVMRSPEVSYQPREPLAGFRGEGFRELDHSIENIDIPVYIPQAGKYAVSLRYANGNGPVNTENKCAIRSLMVDGVKAGTFVLPHRGRGNWNDWGSTNNVTVELPAGEHVLSISFLPEDENMNIDTNHALVDELLLTRVN